MYIAVVIPSNKIYKDRQTFILLCKAKRQYLLTCKVSRYCLLALHVTIDIDKVTDNLSCHRYCMIYRLNAEALIYTN